MLLVKKKYLDMAMNKKNLNKSERNSLLRSISICKDFGDDAQKYLETLKIPNSIIYNYAEFLKTIGVPVFTCRESERYNFMLYISLQQTWKSGLGDIIKHTKFIPLGKSDKPKNMHLTNDQIMKKLKDEDVPQKVIEEFMESVDASVLRYLLVYAKFDRYLILSFSKPSNKFEIVSKFESFSKETDQEIHFEDTTKSLLDETPSFALQTDDADFFTEPNFPDYFY